MRQCKKCQQTKPLSEFYQRSETTWFHQCKECKKAYNRRKQTPSQQRAWRIKKSYGVTTDQYNHMMVMQSDRCAICLTDEKPRYGYWHIDHDHQTGKVRGLLCEHCNHGLGKFSDDADNMRAAIKYLEVHV